MFLKNFWYVAATEDEVGRTPLGREICGEPVALWRQEDGTAVAISDRCPHRRYALSKGELVGDDIQCGYHGLRFDGQGACTHVPGQDNIPPRLKGRCYPVVERHKWVFIWMGDIEDADPDLIPDYHWNDAEGWEPVFGTMKFAAHYQLLVDNLLDLTHETFLHAKTIGNEHEGLVGQIGRAHV